MNIYLESTIHTVRILTPEDYDALNTDLLKAFYKQYYLNGSCKIFVAGKMPTGYEAMLNKAFGTLPLHADSTSGGGASYCNSSTKKGRNYQ